jgi:hypothetical protein
VLLFLSARLGLALDVKDERQHVHDVALRVALEHDRPGDREARLIELSLSVKIEERRDQRVAAARALDVVVVAVEVKRHEARVDVRALAVAEVQQ